VRLRNATSDVEGAGRRDPVPSSPSSIVSSPPGKRSGKKNTHHVPPRQMIYTKKQIGCKTHYYDQVFFWVLIDLVVELLSLIIKPCDNQTELKSSIK
jgi:hypothetical protein